MINPACPGPRKKPGDDRSGPFFRSLGIAVFCLAIATSANSQGKAEPSPTEFTGLAVVAPGTALVIGDRSTILRTTDGGTTWTRPIQPNLGNFILWDIEFTDSLRGFAAGERGIILVTEDGGKSWDTTGRAGSSVVRSISFPSRDSGWAVGPKGAIFRTTDGGKSWSTQFSRVNNELGSVAFTDGRRGVIVGSQGIILRTTDGGATWSGSVSTVSNYLASVTMTDTLCWAVGGYGAVLHSTDAGATWEKQNIVPGTLNFRNPMAFYRSIDVASSGIGFVTGSLGVSMRTTDRGRKWEDHTGLPPDHLNFVVVESDSTFWIGGNGGFIAISTDGLRTWVDVSPSSTP